MSEELNERDILKFERARIEKLKTGKAALRKERNFLRRKHLEALAKNATLQTEVVAARAVANGAMRDRDIFRSESDKLRAEVERLKAERNTIKEQWLQCVFFIHDLPVGNEKATELFKAWVKYDVQHILERINNAPV